MSDYLGNLITRTLSHESAVRPRLRSIFERAPSDHFTRLGPEREGGAESSFPAAHYSTPPAAPFNSFDQSNRASSTPTESSPEQTPGDIGLSHRDSTSGVAITVSTPPTHSIEPVKPVKSLTKEKPSTSTIRELTKDDFIQNASVRRIRPEPVSAQAEANIDPGITESRFTPAPTQNNAPAHPSGNDASSLVAALTKSAKEKVGTPDRPPAKARNVRAVEAVVPVRHSASQIPSNFSQPAESAINVTIGRVEIRATPAPPASQRSAPKSGKVLSLENYLRQRAKGDRR